VLVPDTTFTVESVDGDTTWRVHVFTDTLVPRPDQSSSVAADTTPRIAAVALPIDSVTSIVSRVVKIELAASGGLLLVLAGTSWALIGLGLKPLLRMEQTAAAISSGGDLHQRIDVSSERTELGRLGTTLNEMLGRLEGSFEAQQQSERRLRRFIADASHELRTPLTSIRGYAELHRRGMKSPEQADRGMERIEAESVRMSHLVEDLLALARLDERAPLDKQPFDLGSAVNDLVEDARVVEPLRRIGWTPVSASVIADRLRIMQAVANLISNVRMHTEPDTPVDIAVEQQGGRVVISVADHGTGIPPEQMASVFDRFFRSDESRARPTGGAGLGLSIVAAVAKAHDGKAWAEETPGGGATFKIEITAEPR
jgi:two-component system OmpR family sensor kinase